MLINLESFTKENSSALKRFSYHLTSLSLSITEVILASSTPLTEEHTKLLDHLSEPSSQLIHHISHPPEEDVFAEVVTSCFVCIQVHSFASCIPAFCKKSLSVTSTAENCLRSETPFKHWLVLNSFPLQTMYWCITPPSWIPSNPYGFWISTFSLRNLKPTC